MRTRSGIAWTEGLIQNALYCHCAIKRHELIVPNSKVFGWESDLISVSRAGTIHEFEIKVSRSDFKADAKKDKSAWMVDPFRISWGVKRSIARPNHFYYVTPPDLVTLDEVPQYAGLIYAEYSPTGFALYCGTVTVVREAPRLHKDKISEWQKCQLHRATTSRYWRQRLGADKEDAA